MADKHIYTHGVIPFRASAMVAGSTPGSNKHDAQASILTAVDQFSKETQ